MIVDVFIGIAALSGQIFMQVLMASIKPWRYCFSSGFRKEVNEALSHKPQYLTFLNFLGGIIIIFLSIGVVVFLIKFFFFTQEPEPSAIDKFEETVKTIVVDTIKKQK